VLPRIDTTSGSCEGKESVNSTGHVGEPHATGNIIRHADLDCSRWRDGGDFRVSSDMTCPASARTDTTTSFCCSHLWSLGSADGVGWVGHDPGLCLHRLRSFCRILQRWSRKKVSDSPLVLRKCCGQARFPSFPPPCGCLPSFGRPLSVAKFMWMQHCIMVGSASSGMLRKLLGGSTKLGVLPSPLTPSPMAHMSFS
jgi:hypothetical protein